MAIHRDSPGPEPEADEAEAPEPHRRFRRLVESSTTRRLVLPRLALVAGVGLSAIVSVGFLGSSLIRSVTTWVASRPEQQLPFSKIELVPEPPPWIKIGKAGILEQVRLASKRDKTLSLLDLDLKDLSKDFLLGSPWVAKVDRIERPPRGLIVRLEYRKPVAAVRLVQSGRLESASIIDDHAVTLDPGEIAWESSKPPYQIVGSSGSLVIIMGVDNRSKPTFGVPWKTVTEDGKPGEADPMLLKAAQLADFLRNQPEKTPSGRPGPEISEIFIPEGQTYPFFLKDRDQNLIRWGRAPGDEKAGELTAEARWKMLLDWVDAHGPIHVKPTEYVDFGREGLVFPRFVKKEKTAN